MKKVITFLLLFSFFGAHAQDPEVVAAIKKHGTPEWFQNAKLGIFIHWGLYSVPAYGGKESYSEWFLRGLQTNDSIRVNFMKETYGEDFTYNDFAHEFKAELFDPEEWANLFKKAGAKYVVLVSKHHDGYTLWPSKYNRNWNSVDTGPNRDIVGELTEAVRDAGLKMGLYYSLMEWNHPLHRWYTDPNDSVAEYVETYMIPQFKELVSTYKPSLIFTDGGWFNTAKQMHSAELIHWYYQLIGEEAIVNNRWGHGLDVGFLTPEYSAGITETERAWVEVRGLGRSFGLNRNEDLDAYATSDELIERFVQTVANGGGMILNVGPRADGQIPLLQQERLMQLGHWLDVNGEAIYGSHPFGPIEEKKTVTLERIDTNINFDWVRNSPMDNISEDDFTATWTGYLFVPESGDYTFEIEVDDEAKLLIDGKMIINNNYTARDSGAEVMGSETTVSEQGKIHLEAGKAYPITLKYREKKQNAKIKLFWMRDGKPKTIVPASAFYQDKNKTNPGLVGRYSSLKTYLAYTQNNGNIYAISFEWPGDTLKLEIENPGKQTSITMLGYDKELDWRYENGSLYIDTSLIEYSDLPSDDAWTFKIDK